MSVGDFNVSEEEKLEIKYCSYDLKLRCATAMLQTKVGRP